MNTKQIILNDFINKHPFAAAKVIEGVNCEEAASFLQTLPLEKSMKLLGLMRAKSAAECFVLLPYQKTKELLDNGNPSIMASVLRLIDTALLKDILANVSSDKLAIIESKLEHTSDTVGGLMEPPVIVSKEMIVRDAVQMIKNLKELEEFYLYVIDIEGIFKGIVRLKELLVAEQTDTLKNLMITSVPKLFSGTPIKSIINHPAWLEYRYIPVIDNSEKLLGTIAYSTVIRLNPKSDKPPTNELMETGSALGDLYLIGLTGLLKSVSK